MSGMKKVLVLLMGPMLLHACFYSDSEWYRVDPVADDPPIVTVVTNLDTLDNPRVNDSLQVIYDLSIENGNFYYLDAVVADQTIFQTDTTYGSFWIYPEQSTGVDTLYMDFYHSSNTNTLADVTGYEARITRLKYAIDFTEEVQP